MFRDQAIVFGLDLARRRRADRRLPRAGRAATSTCRSRSGCCSAARSATSSTGSAYGYVVDWVDMGIGDIRFWTFNVADAAITVGDPHAHRPGALPEPAPSASGRRRMPDGAVVAGPRTLRVPDGPSGRVDRFVADATGLSRSYVQKLISDGRLTADGAAAAGERDRRRGRRAAARRAAAGAARARAGARHPGRRRLRGRRPAHRRQAVRARRASRRPGHSADTLVNAPARPGRRRRVRRDRRGRAPGHRPSPRPRHERPADGRQARRRAGVADGPAQGAADQEDVPRARPGERLRGRRPDRGADRARPEATDADGGRRRRAAVGDRLPRPRAVRRLDAPRARPGDRADAPDPRPSRRHRASGRRRPGLRRRDRAARSRPASTGCSSTPGGSSSTRRRTATSSARPRRSPPSSRRVLEDLRAAEGPGH